MGLLHYVSGNGFGHSKRKTHVYLRLCVSLDSGIEPVFLSFGRLHIYHACMSVRSKGCITWVTLNFNHINMLIRFKGCITLNNNS